MAKKRILAKVNVKVNKDELVYFKKGTLIAVKANRKGGKKGRKFCKH